MVFYTLLSIKVDLVVSTVIGYLSGTVASYLLNRKLTFRVLDQPIRRLILFFATAALGSALSAILILLGTQTTNFSALLIKVATLPVVAVFQFVLNKTWTFRIGN
jgi:putative flippase GtrA